MSAAVTVFDEEVVALGVRSLMWGSSSDTSAGGSEMGSAEADGGLVER